MRRRALLFGIILTSLCGLAIWLLLPRSAEAPKSERSEVVFALENEVASLDPVKVAEIFTFRVTAQLYEGLLEVDEKSELQPSLAESWASNDDFTVWTLKVRRGVRFHPVPSLGLEPRELAPSDVVYSLERSMATGSVSSFVLAGVVEGAADFQAGHAEHVGGISIRDDSTVEIRLVRPEATFLHRLTSPYIAVFRKEAVEQGGDAFGAKVASGTGPYKLDRRDASEIALVRNDAYWRPFGSAAPTRIVYKVLKSDPIRLIELQNGRVDAMRLVPALIASNTKKSGDEVVLDGPLASGHRLIRSEGFNSHFIAFNAEKLPEPLRRAVSLGVNRSEAFEVVGHGIGRTRVGTIPEGCNGYRSQFPPDIHDQAAAAALLRELPGDVPAIELLVHEQDSTDVLGELLQSQLAKFGVRLNIRKLDFNTALQRMIDGNFEAVAMSLSYIFSDPEPILRSDFHSSGIPVPNFWRYRSDEVDQMLDCLSSASGSEALALAARIEEKVVRDSPAVFLYELDYLHVVRRDLETLRFTRLGVPLFWKLEGS